MALDRGTHTAYVTTSVAKDAGAVSVIDTVSNQIIDTLASDGLPLSVAVDETTHSAYVTYLAQSTIEVLDTTTRKVTGTITDLPFPGDVAIDASTHTAYVTHYGDNGPTGTVSVIDTMTRQVTDSIAVVNRFLDAVAVDQNTHTAYLAGGDTGTVAVIKQTGSNQPTCPTVSGAIGTKYASLGGCDSFLGKPTTTELTTPDGIGRYTHFQNGSIYWTPTTGELDFLFGRVSQFQRGFIYYSPATGVIPFHW